MYILQVISTNHRLHTTTLPLFCGNRFAPHYGEQTSLDPILPKYNLVYLWVSVPPIPFFLVLAYSNKKAQLTQREARDSLGI